MPHIPRTDRRTAENTVHQRSHAPRLKLCESSRADRLSFAPRPLPRVRRCLHPRRTLAAGAAAAAASVDVPPALRAWQAACPCAEREAPPWPPSSLAHVETWLCQPTSLPTPPGLRLQPPRRRRCTTPPTPPTPQRRCRCAPPPMPTPPPRRRRRQPVISEVARARVVVCYRRDVDNDLGRSPPVAWNKRPSCRRLRPSCRRPPVLGWP